MSLADDRLTAPGDNRGLPPLDKSLAMQARARAIIPGMVQLLSKRPDMYSLGVWPGYFQKAAGAEVWDLDGNRYLDMSIAGIGANILGYCDPDVDAAVIETVRSGNSASLNGPEEVELAELLCEIHPWADRVRFARTGGESMAIAVRIARAASGRDVVAFCGYHGWHDWYLAANVGTENALGEHLISGLDPAGVPRGLAGTALPFRYNHLEDLEAIVAEHGGRLGAIVMEPTRGETPQPDFLAGVRRIADAEGVPLVVDEISAGFRMGASGAHMMLGLEPDIAVFSKALGNGYSIAAVIGRQSVMEAAQRSFISSTYWTERLGPAAALATVRKHRACNVGAHVCDMGARVQQGWTELGAKHGLDLHAGGMYPMSHFEIRHETPLAVRAYFTQLMLAQGILAGTRFYAMYAHTDAHLERYMDAVDQAFAAIREAIDAGDLMDRLVGKPAVTGFKRIA